MRPKPPVLGYRTPPQRTRRWRRVPTPGEELFKLSALAAVYVLYGAYGDPYKPVLLFLAMGVVGWLTVAAAVFIRSIRQRILGPTAEVAGHWRRIIGLVFLLTSISLFLPPFGFYTCPHGSRWANRVVGIAYSGTGGPCHNGVLYPRSAAWHIGGNWYVYFFPHE